MGILVKDEEQKSRLAEHVASEILAQRTSVSLEEESKKTAVEKEKENLDAGRFWWFWLLLTLSAVVALIVLMFVHKS